MKLTTSNPAIKLKPHPSWPNERGFDRYEELSGLNIGDTLSKGGEWIDIGSGTEGLALIVGNKVETKE